MKSKPRKRRPAFDREQGVEIAKALFHARGYDAVSVADLTAALGVVPPSLYAAYGSKLALFERALVTYTDTEALDPGTLLESKLPPNVALTELLMAAARHYTRDAVRRGCMVTEAMRADDPQAAELANGIAAPGRDAIAAYVAKHAAAKDVESITDYVLLTLRGLSSYACLGHSQAKLVECARIAGHALDGRFEPESRPKSRSLAR